MKRSGSTRTKRTNVDEVATHASHVGAAGELHQTSASADTALTTNQGVPIGDDQNSLRIGVRGPTLLEDFVLREKITHFDHERIPERIVHARGSGAHGYFQPTKSLAHLTKAAFLADPEQKTPVFARFSTVAGGAGSGDLPRDVRGFAVKFYTSDGNFDLVGNNVPVFFIQDAMKFPDLVHSVKMEPDRGFPQAASAHDTFWDFVSLMPETMHMLLWVMSDRAVPRSLRMMEGFGVHTFRLVAADGTSRFVKFHYRPTIGSSSVLWDEAVKINGADPDFHRRDLWAAIERGDFPTWDVCIQIIDEATLGDLGFDILDSTKLVPEEIAPLEIIGRLVLDRNPDNFFAETEQVAFHPGHIVPGIDFTDDPLLQGRLHSYLDTQLSRLGGPNFHQLPINQPKCPMRNFQRDGIGQTQVPRGRVAYEPNSLDPEGPRESAAVGFESFATSVEGTKSRERSASFSDHYSQARSFFRSMSEPEQSHIVSAFAFELGKVETIAIRTRMLGHLDVVDPELGARVADALGMIGDADAITPARAPVDLPRSGSLSLVEKARATLEGRHVAVLVTAGCDRESLDALRSAVEAKRARLSVVAPKASGILASDGKPIAVDFAVAAAPSVFFDAVAILSSADGSVALDRDAHAVGWLRDAFEHLKVIGLDSHARDVSAMAGVVVDEGVVPLDGARSYADFVSRAASGRIWGRASKV